MSTSTCMRSDFRQGLPRHPDEFELISGGKRSGSLQYRDPVSDTILTVPNVPHNQSSEVRLEAYRFFLAQQESALRSLRNHIPTLSQAELEGWEKRLEQSRRAIRCLVRRIEVKNGLEPVSALLFTREEVSEHIARYWHEPLSGTARCRIAWIAEELSAGYYHLLSVPLLSIPGYDHDAASPELATSYARLATAAPAIVLATTAEIAQGNILIDGYHRLRAAWERGDCAIPAYVPVEG